MRGFTLSELIIAIALLVVIATIALPNVLNLIKNGDDLIDESSQTLILDQAASYVNKNIDSFVKNSDRTYCISINKLQSENYLSSMFVNSLPDEIGYVKVKYNENYIYEIVENCVES